MKINEQYIPKRFRNKDLSHAGGSASVSFNSNSESPSVVGVKSHDKLEDVHAVGDLGMPISARNLHLTKPQADEVEKLIDKEFIIEDESQAESNNTYSASFLKKAISVINEAIELIKKTYLSRVKDDTAEGRITFLKGIASQGKSELEDVDIEKQITSKEFSKAESEELTGSGFGVWKDEHGDWRSSLDYITVRKGMNVNTLRIKETKSLSGAELQTLANQKNSRVEDMGEFYRCYFDNDEETIMNYFEVGDLAICQKFEGKNQKRYWRAVVGVGGDYIDLSKTDKEEGSDSTPEVGDEVVQFGNKTDTERQNAILRSAFGNIGDFKYKGINDFTTEGKLFSENSLNRSFYKGEKFIVETSEGDVDLHSELEVTKEEIRTTVWDKITNISTSIQQFAKDIKLVVTGLKATGIYIEEQKIVLSADKVVFKNSEEEVPLFKNDVINPDIAPKDESTDYLKQALKQETSIEGGLILSSLIGARDGEGKVRSYQSGTGEKAFASGVEGFGTAQEKDNVHLKHNGAAKIGQLNIDEDGEVFSLDEDKNRWLRLFAKQEIPDLQQVLAIEEQHVSKPVEIEAIDNDRVYFDRKELPSGGASTDGFYANNLRGTEFESLFDGAQFDYTQEILVSGELVVPFVSVPGKPIYLPDFSGSVSVGLSLEKINREGNYEFEKRITRSDYLYISRKETEPIAGSKERFKIDKKISVNFHTTLKKGKYRIVADVFRNIKITEEPPYGEYHRDESYCFISLLGFNGKLNLTKHASLNRAILAGNLLFYMLGETILHLTSKGLTIRGNTDIPGVLAAGTVLINGTQKNVWGAKASKGDCYKISKGKFAVPHAVGRSTGYTVFVNAESRQHKASCTKKQDWDLYIETSKAGNSELDDVEFDYLIIGSNH